MKSSTEDSKIILGEIDTSKFYSKSTSNQSKPVNYQGNTDDIVRIGGGLYSKTRDTNYQGMHVPNGHGSIFRGMDYDKKLADRASASIQQQFQGELDKAKGGVTYRLNQIESNCVNIFIKKLLDELKDSITDTDIDFIYKHNTHNLIFGLEGGAILAKSKQWSEIKARSPEIFEKYKVTYDSIRNPFKEMSQKLDSASSTVHVQMLEKEFMSGLEYLKEYFEFLEGSNGNDISLIRPKENILELANELKVVAENRLELFDEKIVEAPMSIELQNALAKIRELEELNKQQAQVIKSFQAPKEEKHLQAFNHNSEMERMIAKMKEMEALLKAKDEELKAVKEQPKNIVTREEVEAIVAENNKNHNKNHNIEMVKNQKIIAEKTRDNEFLMLKNEFANDKLKIQDKSLVEKDKVIEELRTDKQQLKQEVKEWKMSCEIKDKQLIELSEKLKQNDKEPLNKLPSMHEFLNESFVKDLQPVLSHEHQSKLSGESSFVMLEENH